MSKDQALQSLRPTTNNPRIVSAKTDSKLDETLAEYGDLSGIVNNVNPAVSELLGGNQRTRKFKLDPTAKIVITERLDEPNSVGSVAWGYVLVGDERFTYREVFWDKPRHVAASIAANNIHGDNDLELLSEQLHELRDEDEVLFELTGYDDESLDKLLDGYIPHDENGPVPDDKPKVKKYSIDELKTELNNYPYSEHKNVINPFLEWLHGRG
jgi:hypothetical protein